MTELDKIRYAKSFIDKLAVGVNPIDGAPVGESDIVRNVRIGRCLAYVSEILSQVIDNGGTTPIKNSDKYPFRIAPEKLREFELSETPMFLSDIVEKLNEISKDPYMRKFHYSDAARWLIRIGLMYETTDADGRKKKLPTDCGRKLGIITDYRIGPKGEYTVVLFDTQAQQFILDNIYTILEYIAMTKQ